MNKENIHRAYSAENAIRKNQIEKTSNNGDSETRRALIYCDVLDLFDNKAKEFEKSKKKRAELSLLLFHSYFSQENLKNELNENPILQTRYSTYELNNIVETLKPKIEIIKNKRNEQKFGTKEKAIAAYRVYRKTFGKNNLCEVQKHNLLNEIGYSEEGMKITNKIATSAKITAALFPVYAGAESAAFGTMLANNWIKILPINLNEENLRLALGISIAADVALAAVDAAVDLKLLRKKSIGTCPDLPTTALYYLLEKFLPEKKRTQNSAIVLASVIPTVIQDLIFQPMSSIFAKNVVKITLQTVESLIKYGYFKKKSLDDKKLEKTKEPF